MFKKIVLFALMLVPSMAFAQESQKIAYFKSFEVISVLPEYTQLQDSLQKQATALQSEFEIMQREYNTKVADFQENQATLIESIKVRRIQEIESARTRIASFQESAQQAQEQLQQTLFTPIQLKVKKAVEEVATENRIAYVLEEGNFLYISPQSLDITPLVKKKLGLQ
jgi:outer membrane protein